MGDFLPRAGHQQNYKKNYDFFRFLALLRVFLKSKVLTVVFKKMQERMRKIIFSLDPSKVPG
jgi:hypothetical protein